MESYPLANTAEIGRMDIETSLILVFLVSAIVLGGAILALVAWWSQRHTDKRGTEPRKMTERRERGECVICGYDLKGNLSGRCPECGTRIWQ